MNGEYLFLLAATSTDPPECAIDGFYLPVWQRLATPTQRFGYGRLWSAMNRADPPGTWWVLFYTVRVAPAKNAKPTIVRTKCVLYSGW